MKKIIDIGFVGYGNYVTDDAIFKPLPHNYKHGLKTPIVLVNNISDVHRKSYDAIRNRDGYDVLEECHSSGLLTRKIGTLDFYNEISGFLHVNVTFGHSLYDASSGICCIPEDLDVKSIPKYHESKNSFPGCVGAIIIDSNFDVYICYGFEKSDGGMDIYFDWT